ncbi:MAG: hypothetical protein IPH44_22945 [Myxococcales bacterium]|nr:hypothetical protein [Myxococcales bacterium]MBK7192216.1 hypothetical protein [Myxococcales bacterium]MBP6847459.1 hypothetical protein [Kofleriaceae bacterium]
MWKRLALGALALIVVALAVLLLLGIREGTRAPKLPAAGSGAAAAPITDVGRGRAPPTVEAQPPPVAGEVPVVPSAYVAPTDLPDPARPPAGTAVRAAPGTPAPPDPAVEPAIAQDPDRGRRP